MKRAATKLAVACGLLVAACLIAGTYGACHNQVSYTVSPEYFTVFKFQQFDISPTLPDRVGAAVVGWCASWWMGLIIGAVLIPCAYVIRSPGRFAATVLRSLAWVAVTALIVGVGALVVALFSLHEENVAEITRYGQPIDDDVAFARAGTMHNFSYLGGLLGILSGVFAVRRGRIRFDANGTVHNFGHNVRFRPATLAEPRSEAELLHLLQSHDRQPIRVIGSKHAWSGDIETTGLLLDQHHFRSIQIHSVDGETCVTVGGGCQVKHLLRELNAHGYTLPSVGLITEQTIAGATATGTHGSGRHSLSHYIRSARIACFRDGDSPQIVTVDDGDDLRAARCSLGCLGVVVEVTLPCVEQYYVEEFVEKVPDVSAAIALEGETPLQQFFLIPHSWDVYVQRRRVGESRRRGGAALYRAYWFVTIDLGLHLMVKCLAVLLKSRRLVHAFYRRLLPVTLVPGWHVTDRSDRQLVMEHELFRHLELELFLPRTHVAEATEFLIEVLGWADGSRDAMSPEWLGTIRALGEPLSEQLKLLRGTYTHHYPICYRRVEPDDTLISMTAQAEEDWYAISLITYRQPRDDFYATAEFLARCMAERFGGRIHWGKWFPADAPSLVERYEHLSKFRQIAQRYDPHGQFRSAAMQRKLLF